jgi:hypothetical protein
MPVTPFHGGIGLLLKGALGRRFSFLLFCCTQVVIDLESGYHLLRGDWPVHRFLHTLVGASLASLVAVFASRRPVAAFGRWIDKYPDRPAWVDSRSPITWRVALVTAFAGVLAHVIPDAIMHSDVEPFAPASALNPLLGLVSLPVLHAGLVVIGVLGLVMMISFGRRQV